MTPYIPPLRHMRFVLEEVIGLESIAAMPGFEEAGSELAESILTEAGRFAEEVLSPLNRVGDQQGARLEDGKVLTASGWKEAWATVAEGGWIGLPFPTELGGMGLPQLFNTAVHEMWQAANMAFTLNPMLTQGAIHAIALNGSAALKARYLPKMISGRWTGTMNLTEPQAGTDLAALRTRAVPDGAAFRLTGQKIFITYGDHDLAENIVHLVLARLPDAPAGVKGISLFVVPKVLDDGSANDLRAVSLEHKLGIHGSPTAVMSYGDHGGAWGEIVGQPNRGLEYMFAMMNHARLAVGLQGLGIAERAYQQAHAYARERVQGRPAGWTEARIPGIAHHPDVRRLLMTMKSAIEAMRGIHYTASVCADIAHSHPEPAMQAEAQARLEFLTPIAKGWCTEMGQAIASMGVQIHGGMGYIEETGAAQHLRDARITTIYEGTTAIQANDLVGRKIQRDKGGFATTMMEEIENLSARLAASGNAQAGSLGRALALAAMEGRKVIGWLCGPALADARLPAAAAVPVLELMGLVEGGRQLGLAALVALEAKEDPDGFYAARLASGAFFAAHLLCHAPAHAWAAMEGAATVMTLDECLP